MDVQAVLTAISTVGFPIVMCLILLKFQRDESKLHKEETEKFTEALNRNTIVLQKLCDKMGVENE